MPGQKPSEDLGSFSRSFSVSTVPVLSLANLAVKLGKLDGIDGIDGGEPTQMLEPVILQQVFLLLVLRDAEPSFDGRDRDIL